MYILSFEKGLYIYPAFKCSQFNSFQMSVVPSKELVRCEYCSAHRNEEKNLKEHTDKIHGKDVANNEVKNLLSIIYVKLQNKQQILHNGDTNSLDRCG